MTVTAIVLLVAGRIQEVSPQPVWYNAGLLGAAVTAAGAFVTDRYAAWRDRKRRREALLASYLGEVNVIRKELVRYLNATKTTLESESQLPGISELALPAMPTKVFEETVGNLGEIGDAKLVELIASLYAQIEHAEETTRGLVKNTESVPEEFRVGHFQQHLALLGRAAITLYVTKELLAKPRAQATRLLKDKVRVEEAAEDFKFIHALNTLLGSTRAARSG